jgi:hypothetical protein
MRPSAWTLRLAALMGAGTFGVHQARFALYDESAGGHGYLVAVGPVVVALVLLSFAALLGRLARGAAEPAPRFRRLWIGTSASLLVVYGVQESLEGLLSAGHPALDVHGGWVVLPLTVAIGLAIALVMRGAADAAALAVARTPWRAPAPAPVQVVLPPWAPRSTHASARHLAARGPPVVSV